MELRHLTYFVAVAERLNFSRAAEDLHVAQPAISQQIHSLEKELGEPLFERTGKRVQLTDAGQTLLPHARQILSAVQAARDAVRERGQLVRGTAKLGAPPTVSAHFLPARLTAFERKFPGLDVRLREAGTDSLLKFVAQGDLDLAIVSVDAAPANIDWQAVLEEDYVLAVGHRHPLGQRASVAMSELKEEAFILFPDGYKLREVTLTACQVAGFKPHIALDGGSMQSALQFVAAGLGVAVVPQLALTSARGIHPLTITDQTLRRSLGLVWRKGQYLNPAARALRDFLLK